MADFPRSRARPNGPFEVAVRHDSPMLREWAIVCDAPDAAACLTGFERPSRSPGEPRRFEAVWTVDPVIVREAAHVGIELAAHYAPSVGRAAEHLARDRAPDPALTAQRAGALANRVIAYLER
jgi:DICT domain-containing protein